MRMFLKLLEVMPDVFTIDTIATTGMEGRLVSGSFTARELALYLRKAVGWGYVQRIDKGLWKNKTIRDGCIGESH